MRVSLRMLLAAGACLATTADSRIADQATQVHPLVCDIASGSKDQRTDLGRLGGNVDPLRDAASSTAAMATQLCSGTDGLRQLVGELRTTAGAFQVNAGS